jgi:putative membrane protein
MMYWSGHMSTAGWILSVLWTLIVVALVVAGIVWLISTLGDRGAGARSREGSAREILDRRLARGEITLDQYEELRNAVDDQTRAGTGGRPSPPAGVSS